MNHLRAFWLGAALSGAVLLAMGCLRAFEIHLESSVGADDEQQVYNYLRTWSFASYGTSLSIAALVLSLAVVAVSVVGLRRSSVVALAAVTLLALGLNAITTSAGFPNDSGGGFESCDSWLECGGPFLNPGVRELQREAATRPEAKQSEYLFDPAYTARSLAPWKVILFGSLALLCAGGFLLFRSFPLLLLAGPFLGPISVLAGNAWNARIYCPVSTAELAEGELAVYPALFGLLSGAAALSVKKWKLGGATVVITLVTGLYALLVVGFTCEN